MYYFTNNSDRKTFFIKKFPVYIVTHNQDDLLYLSGGVPNSVYYDKKLNGVIKINKRANDNMAKISYIDKSYDDIKLIDTYMKNIIKTLKTCKIINPLESFLKIKGYVIYPHIMNNLNNDFVHSPLYEYLQNVKDDWVINDKIKDDLFSIIKDFKQLNMDFYMHGDLQRFCRNIVKHNQDSLKIVDVDSIKKMFYNYILSVNYIKDNVKRDILSLASCFQYKKLLRINIDDFSDIIDQEINDILRLPVFKDMYYKEISISYDPWVKYEKYLLTDSEDIMNISFNTNNPLFLQKIKELLNKYYDELLEAFVSGVYVNKKIILIDIPELDNDSFEYIDFDDIEFATVDPDD